MKSLRQTARRRVLFPVVALAALLLAAAAPGLTDLRLTGPGLAARLPAGSAAVPAAQAWEYRALTYRVARIHVPDTTAYPGTNTNVAYQFWDAAGALIEPTGWRDETGVAWSPADDAAAAIVADLDHYGVGFNGYVWIPIRADAAPGDYTFNIQNRARSYDREPESAASTMTLTIIGPPDSISAYLGSRTEYDPGERIIIRATVRDANGALATFTRDPVIGHGVPERCRDCFFEAADSAAAAALEIPEGYLHNGVFRARVAANAPPGEYHIIVSHPTAGAQTLAFTVTGDNAVVPAPEPTPTPGAGPGAMLPPPALPPGPASYALAGHRAIGAGRTAIFTVTGADAAGGLPNLEGTNADVYVLVDGPGKDAVTISGITDGGGTITLDDSGVGTFALRVADGTQPTTVGLELVGALGSEPIIRDLNIGTEQPPLPDLGDAADLTLTAGTGDAAGSVTLRWTAGAHADRHWIAGIKVSDWDAGNFDNIIWTRAAANDTHTVTGLEAGAEYAFTVIAGRLVNGVAEWGSWAPIKRVTVSAQ